MRRETGKEYGVKVSYDKDPASHIDPKPCVGARDGNGEASVGACTGWPSSLVNYLSGADAFAHAKEGAAAFLVDLAKVCDEADLLRMFGLRYDKKLVAAALAFVHRNTVYAFAGGHDPDFESLGFGRLLLFEGLRHAFQQGCRAWNFLRGNEPYKLLWGAQITPTARITIERKPNASEAIAAPKLQ